MAEAKQLFGAHERILQPRIIEILVFDFKIIEFQIRLAWGKILVLPQVIEITTNLLVR